MGVFDKFKDMIGVDDYEDELLEGDEGGYDSSYYEPQDTEPATGVFGGSKRSGTVVSMQDNDVSTITSAFQLVIIEPEGFEDCSKLVDDLKNRKPVILNLEKLDIELARKIFDFLGGATYALNGSVQKVANNIFVFAPESVGIDSESEHKPYDFEDKNEDYNPWK